MKLRSLLHELDPALAPGDGNPDIKGVACDSRRVKPDFLFVAVPGHRQDGRDYIRDALERGAVAIVTERAPSADGSAAQRTGCAWEKSGARRDPPGLVTPDARFALAKLAAAFYGYPSRALRVAGITGTNGKTTTAYLLRDLLQAAGGICGMIGTVEYNLGGRVIPATRTTPDAPALQSLLAEMVQAGCQSAVMEVSSHALSQQRAACIDFDVAAFTNLTRDHLDYHGDMESYYAAKHRLFEALGRGAKRATAAVNRDDEWGRRLLGESGWGCDRLSYGMDGAADVRAEDVRLALDGARFRAVTPWGAIDIATPLLGRFNVANVLAALTCGGVLGIDLASMAEKLRSPLPAPGRMERVPMRGGVGVFVDYAHTDDALDCALRTLRPLCKGRLIAVFGCGGNRDRSKRPAMGRIADRRADYTILTSDNPRGEDPADIIGEIRAGFAGEGRYEVEEDRRLAIERALRLARKGDVVLVAGKGHETFQEFAHRTAPFDDRQVVRSFRSGAAGESVAGTRL